jgi:hypothetical protein
LRGSGEEDEDHTQSAEQMEISDPEDNVDSANIAEGGDEDEEDGEEDQLPEVSSLPDGPDSDGWEYGKMRKLGENTEYDLAEAKIEERRQEILKGGGLQVCFPLLCVMKA